eukprot:CAMPEP_0198728550 /NCGR_PEP_ID=MMETSP1475-20131203/9924_1 /TAXON_ID= ORGANISM="Unidentified sp., Strain CCMP1999" /NCGR_SAMPLE_ID=MMETSP1475 /ASSEMBLY_ACC=CAM_ASM_001111 /LENGTH=483 /DNA_ID=CAMNT_0044490949 /DNA_START=55 /DNA_END=1503 /DNA_ORIENTATION=+
MAAARPDDESFWRRKVESLEKERAEWEKELEETKATSVPLREQLKVAQKELKEIVEQNQRSDAGQRPGQNGISDAIAQLEIDLRSGKVGLEQAKFERDSLEAELRALKKALRNAARRPTPGRVERVSPDVEGGVVGAQSEEKEPLSVEAAVKMGDRFRSGTCYLYDDRIRFEPDFDQQESKEEAQWELNTESGEFYLQSKIEEIDDRDMLTAEKVMMRLKIERIEGGPLEFVGFKDAIEAVHTRLASDFFASNPAASMSKRDAAGTLLSSPMRKKQSKPVSSEEVSALTEQPPQQPTKPEEKSASHHRALPTRKSNAYTPKLSESSKVLSTEQMIQVYDTAPMRYRSSDLRLLYSTMRDGISLQTFYQKCAKSAPTFVLIKDSNDQVFGCFASAPWRLDKSYYGTGESYVFSVLPTFEVFRWTRANSYFQFSNADSLAVGGGGHFAIRIDSDFYHGTSNECQTFGNRCLSSDIEFVCVTLEVW